jgi:tetratricopeptide (TPR) repeat protein
MAKTKVAVKSAEKYKAKSKPAPSTQEALSDKKTNGFFTLLERLDASRIVMLLCLVACLAYANSLGGDFVFDDMDQIVENQDIRSWDNLGRAFTTHVWAFRERPEALRVPIPPPYYRPLFTVLFTIEYKLFGLQPQGWHLVSVLLHILCSIGVYYVLRLLAGRQAVAVLGALFFAVYSIHVESVSWISGVTDPLFGVFFLASFYSYLRYKAEKQRPLLLWSLVWFGLSTLSKETALSLVLLIFCAEWIATGKEPEPSFAANKTAYGFGTRMREAVLQTLPYVGVAVLYLIPRYLVIGGIGWDNPHTYHGPFFNVLLTIPFIVCSYVLHLLWPVNLSIAYFTSIETNVTSARVLLPTLALVIAASAVLFYRRKIGKEVWYALALLWIPLLPVLDLRKLSVEYLLFDRYLYLSVIGWVFLLALGLEKLARREEQRLENASATGTALQRLGLSSALAIGLIILLTAATAKENRSWADAHSLWVQAARVRPNFWVTHYNAGLALYDDTHQREARKAISKEEAQRRYAEARDALVKAAQLAPDEPTIFNALGQAYVGMGETSRAIENFKHSFAIDPEMFEAINNLGTIYFDSGDYKAAEQFFKSALALRPQATDFHYNLGLCYSRQGRFAEALPEMEKALQYAPNDLGILYELGLVYEKLGRKEEAVKVLQRGLSISKTQALSEKFSESLNRLTRN